MPKFVDWTPTQSEHIDAFFELAPLSSSDVVYDLGAGDGRLVFAALERGAGKCVGLEIDPDMVEMARELAKKKELEGKVTFIEADVTTVDLSLASVILCYLWPTASAALRKKFEKELKPGTKIIMETFPVRQWKAAKIIQKAGANFYLYVMPPERDADVSEEPYFEPFYEEYW